MENYMKLFDIVLIVAATVSCVSAQTIPAALHGKWIVQRQLPTATISCWGDAEAKAIIGTEIEYTADSLRWNQTVVKHPKISTEIVSAQQFHDNNSGQGRNSSEVSFRQLGIRSSQVQQVAIEHEPSNMPNTPEIPGDVAFVKDKKTLIFSVCNVFFEAKRIASTGARERNRR
jgi:hypothetical protein